MTVSRGLVTGVEMDHLPATMESGFPMYEEECEEPFDQEPAMLVMREPIFPAHACTCRAGSEVCSVR